MNFGNFISAVYKIITALTEFFWKLVVAFPLLTL
jgi:hypothetical protein